MSSIRRALSRIRGLFGRSKSDRDLADEFASHLDMAGAEYERRGLDPAEARRRARLDAGNLTTAAEAYRDRRGFRMLDVITRDFRYAARSLRRTPGFPIAVVLILALGIGMSTVMFTVFKTGLIDRLPIAEQNRLVVMHTLDRSGRHLDVPEAYLGVIARDSALFRGVAGVYHLDAQPAPFLYGSGTITLASAGVTANFFNVLGMRPGVGRFLEREDGQAGAPPVMVLSYSTWQRDFSGNPSVVGRSLVVPYTQRRIRIVGVAPAGFDYPSGADGWTALPPEQTGTQVDVVARLAPRVTLAAARAGLLALAKHENPFTSVPVAHQASESWGIAGVAGRSFAEAVLGDSRPVLIALTVAVGLLLLVACVNISSLVLVRLFARSREVVIRRAIGASTADIARLFACESVLLGAVGGALGFAMAFFGLRVLRAVAPPGLPRVDLLGGIGAPLAAAAGITLLALALFAVLPSTMASRMRPGAGLRHDSRAGTEGRSARAARQWLVGMQIALTVVMLVGAGLLVRTLARLNAMDLGYRPQRLSILTFTATHEALPDAAAILEASERLVRLFEATPGVVAASTVETGPFIGPSLYILKLAPVDQPAPERAKRPFVPFDFVGRDYFRTFSIPIVRGRGFNASDTRAAEHVVVVNETLAKQLWPDQDPLGKRLVRVAGYDSGTTWTVVGIARDTHMRQLTRVGPVAYFENLQQKDPGWSGLVAVRTSRPLGEMLPALREAAHDVNPSLVVWRAETMDQLLDAPLAKPRLSALLLSGFGLVTLLLCSVGLYGLVASGVRRQTHDIGVRMALGATPGRIRRLVIGQVVVLVGLGTFGGLAIVLLTSRLLRSLLYEISPTDPLTLASVCVMLLAVATAAAYLPARRATRIDPVEALRAE